MAELGTLERVVRALTDLLSPLEDDLTPETITHLLAGFGLQLGAAVETDAAVVSSLSAVGVNLAALEPLAAAIVTAAQADDTATMVSKSVDLALAVKGVVDALATFTTALKVAGAGGGVTQAELDAFAEGLFEALLEDVLVQDLETLPGVADVLEFIGFVQRTDVPAVDAAHPAYTLRKIDPSALTQFIQNPAGVLAAKYQWGQPGFDGLSLLQEVARLLVETGLPAVVDTSGAVPVLDLVFLELRPRTDLTPRGLSLKLTQAAGVTGSPTYTAGDSTITLTLTGDLQAGTEIVVQPGDALSVEPPSGSVAGTMSVAWTGGSATGPPFVLFGEEGSSYLRTQQFSAGASVGLVWNSTTNRAEGVFGVSGALTNGEFAVDLGGADGFLGSLFGGQGLTSEFSVQMGYSTASGVYFEGSATLDIHLPTHISLGPIDISGLTLTVGLSGTGVPIGLSADIAASLGPLQASVQELGFVITLSLPADHHGNAGPIDVALAFQPPKGVGLSLDTGVVTGGGYLYIDTARGEYAGAMQLVIADFLSVAAIGLISTRMPDGSSGFSLLIIITADFGAGIQLGFGFTLNAVGGLLGVNRTMLFQPLMDGVRSGAIDSIMFPQNVVANATRIISDLRAIFPPQEGTFLIGPMAKLGWGEPTLVSLSLGIIIEVPPGDIAILGVLKVALPADDIAILVLQVNFAGALEFSKQRLYFFASLYDSHILFITIAGEMGLLFAWGDDANFVVSIGGFHPQFNPPPLPFPTPERVSIDIINESYARIRADGYFAVTTNTVQFGTHSEFFFGFSALSVSGHSSFDALIQFSPFHFTVSISTAFSVQVFGIGVYGIDISLTLEGPTPWHAHGTASLSFFFFSVDVGIDFTWGDDPNTTLPPVAVMPILTTELGKNSNWRAVLPAGSNLLVALRSLDPSESQFVLHPVGVLQVSQRAVPLDLTIDKVGSQAPSDADRFALSVTSADLVKTRNLPESFAPAQFLDMDDAAKLSQAAYGQQDGGIELASAGNAYASGTAIVRLVRFDVFIIDTKLLRSSRRFTLFAGSLFQLALRGSAVAKSTLSARHETLTHPFEGTVTLASETYSVAHQADNTVFDASSAGFASQASANDHLARTVAANPALAGTLHVLPQFEVAA